MLRTCTAINPLKNCTTLQDICIYCTINVSPCQKVNHTIHSVMTALKYQ